MTTAAVTGATGFVGAHLVAELLLRGVKVAALCRENSPRLGRLPQKVEIFHDLDALPEADVFYHLAWEHASGPGRADALAQSGNAGLTARAMLAASRAGCRRFVALGTVYERLAPQIAGSKKFSGSDFYILSKEYSRLMANQLAYKLGIEFVWCTICHPIGRMMKRDQMMAFVADSLVKGKKPALGPALTYYDVAAVEDVALGLRLLGETEELSRREYYIGSGEPKPLREWLEEARDALGVKTPLGIGERADDGLRFDKSWFDISPLQKDTGFAPKVSFAEAVGNIIAVK